MDDVCRAEDLIKREGSQMLGRYVLEHLVAYLFGRMDFSKKTVLGKQGGETQASLKIDPCLFDSQHPGFAFHHVNMPLGSWLDSLVQ